MLFITFSPFANYPIKIHIFGEVDKYRGKLVAIKPSCYMAIKAPVVPYGDNYCPRIANDNQQRDNSLRSCFAHKDQLQSMPHHH